MNCDIISTLIQCNVISKILGDIQYIANTANNLRILNSTQQKYNKECPDVSLSAVHDAVADRMNLSRRLIIVLTSRSFESRSATQPLLSHSDPSVTPIPSASRIWGTYEQRVGLYDALVKEGLKVILVQVEDGVDENSLPESLQYIRRTKGILKWRPDSDGSNRKFWKHLRYQMPPAQRRKSAQMTELKDV